MRKERHVEYAFERRSCENSLCIVTCDVTRKGVKHHFLDFAVVHHSFRVGVKKEQKTSFACQSESGTCSDVLLWVCSFQVDRGPGLSYSLRIMSPVTSCQSNIAPERSKVQRRYWQRPALSWQLHHLLQRKAKFVFICKQRKDGRNLFVINGSPCSVLGHAKQRAPQQSMSQWKQTWTALKNSHTHGFVKTTKQ